MLKFLVNHYFSKLFSKLSSHAKLSSSSISSSSSGLNYTIPPLPSSQKKNDIPVKKTTPVGQFIPGSRKSNEEPKTNQMMMGEKEKMKSERKKPVEATNTPLKPRVLNFDASGSPRNYMEDFIPMQPRTGTVDPTQDTRATATRDFGFTLGSSSQNPYIGNISNSQLLNTNNVEPLQDVGISPIMAK
ncbi:hypothetical protein L1987_08983 [Smallanthus sonchifolius]|uniref:Uncharacterized protein n=1 Tax=Smallanthus sonchifolius TaxID=185202 RepID=A0ACB9JM77_9ASTR|nr:hypothetical protein L1987_08983 [Smallanthus sonchifolius]